MVHFLKGKLEIDHRRVEDEGAGKLQNGGGFLSKLPLCEAESATEARVLLVPCHGLEQRFGLFLRVLAALVARGDERPKGRVVGLFGDRDVEGFEGFVVSVQPNEHLPEGTMGAPALGIEGDPRLLRLDGLGVAPGRREGLREPERVFGVVRSGPEALLVREERLLRLHRGCAAPSRARRRRRRGRGPCGWPRSGAWRRARDPRLLRGGRRARSARPRAWDQGRPRRGAADGRPRCGSASRGRGHAG